MADPTTIIAGAGLGANIGGSLLQAFGAKQSGNAQAGMFQYQAGVAQINKKIDLENADYERALGEVQTERTGIEGGQRSGAIRTVQGASGLDVDSGSNVDVSESQGLTNRFNQAQTKDAASRRAYGFEVKAAGEEAQTQMDIMGAEGARAGGNISALGSLASGASSVASKWIQAKNVGLFSSTPDTPSDSGGMYD